ncbi:opioid-binding protein/cell adhesion molecule homolog isoform X2 [Mercenaria mercenaria]|uniref:opioid-binding protein/cell adhesion molecule homolog isoform X2 n=1 Tax=Mercenaria mercenaria TaxID=6596 RepID=UPI00234EBAE8|nr:opioid-binding protein/cell adhesion molecule homolog isoform X2 [Mercenaria mercenaria]
MKIIVLTVLVPSKIIDETSSRDQTVHEGESFRLLCNVTGVPRPVVTWYMYRMAEENSSQSREKIGGSGEVLVIHNVSRSFDGKYECIAYNNVGPAVSREIMLSVVFAPEIVLPTKRMGQYIGRDTMLEYQIAANPDAITYWKKVDTNTTFQSQEIFQISTFRVSVVLTIKDVLPEDFGEYTCYAENEFGQDQKSMFLYGGEENGTASVTAIHCMAMMSILYVWSKLLL